MGRWEAGARQRLVLAAVELFEEQGYDATTVVQIADRAGLTRSTFFRYFSDKREVLVAGQETLCRLLAEGIADAPVDATPLEAVESGFDRVSSEMTSFNQELGSRLGAAVVANAELRARDALKSVGLAAAMTEALLSRGVPDAAAHLAGELGVLAFRRGFERWTAAGPGARLAVHTRQALNELRDATTALG